MSCNLLVDIGNSGAKIAVANGGDIGQIVRSSYEEATATIRLLAQDNCIRKAIISSVAGDPAPLASALQDMGIKTTVLSAATPLPFSLGYDTPDTFGADRIAAVAGALARRARRQATGCTLIVDAGSCITYEVCVDNVYTGGNIAPGLRMRLRAMHEHTALLPEIAPRGELPMFGHDTETALRAGALRGIQHEVEGYARVLQKDYGEALVVLTGGDAPLIKETLNIEAEVDTELVLRGLNHILEYDEQLKIDN